MAKITMYFNPGCKTCQNARALLEDHDAEIEIIPYMDTPPTTEELLIILNKLGLDDPRAILRTQSPDYEKSGAANPKLTKEQLIKLMVKYPSLIARPIIVKGNKAILGRPAEKVLEIL